MTTKTLVTKNYMALLNSLSDEMKLIIINNLSRSLTMPPKKSKLESLFGAWQDNKSADEIISDIRKSRITGTREIASLD